MAQASPTAVVAATEERHASPTPSLGSYSSLTSSSFPYSEPGEAPLQSYRSHCGGVFELEFKKRAVEPRRHTASRCGLGDLAAHARAQKYQANDAKEDVSEAESEERIALQRHRRCVRFGAAQVGGHPQTLESGAYALVKDQAPKSTGATETTIRDSSSTNTAIKASETTETATRKDEAVGATARSISRPRRTPARSPPRMQRMTAQRPPPTPRGHGPAATTKPIDIPLQKDGQLNSLRRELIGKAGPTGLHYLPDGTEVRMLPNKSGEEMPTRPDSEFIRIRMSRSMCPRLTDRGYEEESEFWKGMMEEVGSW